MNRPIKFRFWGDFGDFNEEADTCEKEMLYGDRFHFFDHAPINDLFADKRFVVMQFTGLVDKNGKEIYEGDIVIVKGTKRIKNYVTEIIWLNNGFCLKENNTYFNDYKLLSSGLEVIGSIHENPEFLK